ncbi:MAG TPA: CARDB domain-containing protein, partial [Verrucomicrobiae bacterium]|nr:CARDB domain-containing protein [Verrucomicrobiae bacterium]
QEAGPVSPGGNYWRSQTVQFPGLTDGTYYLILQVDGGRALYDGNYSNNTVVRPISLSFPSPDLAPVNFQAPSTISGRDLTNVVLLWSVTNQGTGPATTYGGQGWYDTVRLSTSPQGSWSDPELFSERSPESLAAGSSYQRTNVIQLPPVPTGNYYFVLTADGGDSVRELSETNNTIAIPVTVRVDQPDLVPFALSSHGLSPTPPYSTVTVVYAVTNAGVGLALGQNGWVDQLWISQTNVLNGSETYLGSFYQQTTLLEGDVYWRTNEVELPVYRSGSYYLLLRTDGYQYLQESNETNNVLAAPLVLDIQPSDVAIIGVQASESVSESLYPFVTVSWGITNQGPGAALPGSGWRQALYFSTVPALDSNAVYVASVSETNMLVPGETRWLTNRVSLPVETSGSYYLVVSANANNALGETNIANDIAVRPLAYSLVRPDLVPLALECPTNLVVPPYPYVGLTWGVTNQGLGSAYVRWPWSQGHWYDSIWLSASTNVDSSATLVFGSSEPGPVAPGEAYWRTNTLRLPIKQTGTYFLIFTANSSGYLAESDSSNNTVVVALTATVKAPDLRPFVFEAPTLVTGQPYPQISIVWGVTNQGIGPAELPASLNGWYTY